MSQFIISVFLKGWLVIACALFAAIVWHAFRPSARSAMERRGLIPFDDQGGRQ